MRKLSVLILMIFVLFGLICCDGETDNRLFHSHDYNIQTDGSWKCSICDGLLKGTDDSYITVLNDSSKPTTIIPLTSNTSCGNGSLKVSGNIVTYINSSQTAQDVVIRTNSFETSLAVSAPDDNVSHYGFAYIADIQKIKSSSYHEHGTIGRLKVTSGHAVVENTGVVFCAMEIIPDTATITNENTNGKIYKETTKKGGANSSVEQETNGTFKAAYYDCGYGYHNMQKLVVDTEHTYEVCTACGYTVKIEGTDQSGDPVYHTTSVNNDTVGDPEITIAEDNTVTIDDTSYSEPIVNGDVDKESEDDETATCQHEFGEMETVTEPTETTTGTGKYTCRKCGLSYTVEIPKVIPNEVQLKKADGSIINFTTWNNFVEYVNTDGNTCDGCYVTLLKDITISDNSYTGVGSDDYNFMGTFDGNNKKITLNINNTTANTEVALFNVVTGGTIKNVITYGTLSGHRYGAAIAVKLQTCIDAYKQQATGGREARIENCVNYAAITGGQKAAGITQCAYGGGGTNCVISGCKNYGKITVTGTVKTEYYIGGMTAYNQYAILIENCINYGDLEYTNANVGVIAGGIVGALCRSNFAGTYQINNCKSFGTITSASQTTCENNIGGIIGRIGMGNATLSNIGIIIKLYDLFDFGTHLGAGIVGSMSDTIYRSNTGFEFDPLLMSVNSKKICGNSDDSLFLRDGMALAKDKVKYTNTGCDSKYNKDYYVYTWVRPED